MSDRTIAQWKHDLRMQMRATLGEFSGDERRASSLRAIERLVQLDAYRHASTVMVFLPLPSEVDTTAIVLRAFQSGQTVCAPKVDWGRRDMHAVEIQSMADEGFAVDDHGVRSPRDGRPVLPATIDMVIVPGLAFDDAGRRLGRGGGFYDRFLSRLRRSATAVGLAYDRQIVAEVPIEPGDVSVDLVVTDRRVVTGRSSRSSH